MNLRRRPALLSAAVVVSLGLLATSGAGASATRATNGPTVEVVVTLPQPPLARAILGNRTLSAAATTHHKLNLRAPASVSYLRTLASAQRTLQARIQSAIPQSSVRWHYSVVANGLAVTVPRSDLHRLSEIPGATVWPSVTYHEQLDRTPKLIGAPAVWGPTLATAGNGIKIGIIDDGLDQAHVFFDPSSFSYPSGFPKGQTTYTTPKVIVARAFAPASTQWKYANTPFDPDYSDHATNVAGIAAGDHGTPASVDGKTYTLSGIAPNAYLGNYKVLTVPTQDFGLDGNSPEIVKGIDAAVSDGMDVINLSLGEPEIEPSRDIVVAAINAAADAGVVPVVAAGNDFAEAGKGSVGSPGTASGAITVAASSEGDDGPADVIADFSSAGPAPISLLMKPDVTAPGVDILSSLPPSEGTWSPHNWSGTSMASPHVAGAAAVLKQRHPSWSVADIKSALESTGDPVHPKGGTTEVSTLREGGGRIDLPRADNPLIFTDPTGLSFGLVRRKAAVTKQLTLTDAGGGSAPWTTSIVSQTAAAGATLSLSSPTATAGSTLSVTLTVSPTAAEGDATGFIELTRGTDVRRIPYWLHVEVPKLGLEKAHVLTHPGVYGGTTAGGKSLVSSYRYPELGLACSCSNGVENLSGPEQVFQLTVTKPVANIGAVVLSRAKGVRVSPRLVVAGDENRLTGYDGLPVNLNPYQDYSRIEPAVAAIAPAPGKYDLVFDTPAGTKPGRFTFRVWSNDISPPSIRILSHTLRRGAPLKFAVTDAGSGVDVGSIKAKVDAKALRFVYAHGVLRFTSALKAGTHHYTLTVSDYEESKNMENVGPILPNTRSVSGSFVVR